MQIKWVGVAAAGAALALSACSFEEEMVSVGITGYNHIEDESILYFTVNGAGGSNISPWGEGES